ncbi:hypothetical protein J2810_004590 [Chryseobacterium rhizosphaerae]|uniref:hypothetical protein n=1 Tax=Chryseobacterium rhizosphaerae TaxID=395937 RepID=UPI00285DA4FD|nr:hypothetical protein [Chryseobacterium rhizosphaerae]MDR6548500.1 hypothetical protein [Chryseobacterium rhizosphaerae]
MRINELYNTVKGDFIEHKHYGLCLVHENNFTPYGDWFGLAIKPLTIQGYMRLVHESGVLFNTLLEHSKRLLLNKVNDPEIPKLIFKTEAGFEVHEWKLLGEVDKNGEFSSNFLKTFDTIEEAQKYAEK